MSKDRKKVFIKNFGCQMNVRDSEVVSGLLQKQGYKIAKGPEKADILIINTCSVRQHAEDKVWSEIGRYKKEGASRLRTANRAKNKIIGLIGCMAQNYQESIFERSAQVDFAVGPSDINKIPQIIKTLTSGIRRPADEMLFERKIWETAGTSRPEDIYHTGFYEDKNHAYVVISEGCSNYCSYCVVPYVRGKLHNRSHKDILKEIEEAVDKGIKNITLLGQNVNAYRDNGVSFIELLGSVNGIKGLKEFSFITSHPRDTTVQLFEAMAKADKLKKYLHLPVQSGSDRILKLMNRGYSRKYYLDLADSYRKIIKGGLLSTDIIVGFPGESADDFQDTRKLVEKVRFDSAYIFKYSPRPRTAAGGFTDDVPQAEKEKRHGLILELQKGISREKKC